eukprot:CAMPEP_0194162190 /NCGR_PEP_ID=MMETSP0152-20130528/79363_1 /TAXON_ID=1049557 /ORGANISM="Thalassiothrix antarctica, Strain L6-D1" /LENGTH=1229 /DNA_ID=CAMNT_0038872073 /DNA_START=279 /DNA_END=3966 /DNA_ORIENTATION=-
MSEEILKVINAYVKGELVSHIRFDTLKLIKQLDLTIEPDPSWLALSLVLNGILTGNNTIENLVVLNGIWTGNNTIENNDDSSDLNNNSDSENASSAWNMLLGSSFHAIHGDQFPMLNNDPAISNIETSMMTTAAFSSSQTILFIETVDRISRDYDDPHSIRIQIFDSIHLLYEEFKLSVLTKEWSHKVRTFLLEKCLNDDTMNDYYKHYHADSNSRMPPPPSSMSNNNKNENSKNQQRPSTTARRLSSFDRPPCVMSWIRDCLLGSSQQIEDQQQHWMKLPALETVCSRMKLLYNSYSIIATDDGINPIDNDIQIVQSLLDAGIKDPLLLQDDFPIGVALPLLNVLARCRHHPCIAEIGEEFSNDFWAFIGREDACQSEEAANASKNNNKVVKDTDNDGLVGIEYTQALRFPDDNRLKEVGRLLRSSRPSVVKVPRAVEVSDHDYERLKQERLLTLCQRTLALSVGRGMYSLGTLRPVPAEQLPMPELCLSGRVPPANNSIALDTTNTHADMTVWPEFHNGVAAGLRLPPKSTKGSSAFSVSRSWIIYNRATTSDETTNADTDKETDFSHGGLLMALGLRGHLSALSMTDVYEYLTQGSVTTSVGVLLGMAANRRGSCDPSVSKMLCLHIPSLLPPSFSSIDVAAPAHAAAVAGIGLLYQGSSHRLMTEFLLNEMGRRPVHESSTVDRAAYTVSCGLALGMINLARGGSGNNAGLADLEIEHRLYRYVIGGVDDHSTSRQQDIADRRINGNMGTILENERSSRVYEGDYINHDVTAPGALLALGLIYLKSGNKAVAASLAPPDTHFLLEYVRPDTLMLRVITRSLIMWDDVEPSLEWIEKQIPEVVRQSYLSLETTAKNITTFPILGLDDENKNPLNEEENYIIEMENSNVGMDDENSEEDLRSNNSEKKEEQQQQQKKKKKKDTIAEPQIDADVDRQTIRQIHVYVLAGACFSIGLRFAGTADTRAAAAISEVLLLMKSFRDSNDPVPAALRPEQSIVGMCVGICSVSLALVMAGTGDLDTLRLLKMIRWRSDDEIRHGSHMTIASAIGLLFMGGGMYTVGRSAEDIAALLAAFYPRYPMDPMDNKYHLQALRHLYALAVKQRYVQAFDVDSGEEVSVLVKTYFEDNSLEPATLNTPGLLKNTESKVFKLVVQSDIYFASSRVVEDGTNRGHRLFVKKRINDNSRIDSVRDSNFVANRSHAQKCLEMLRDGLDGYLSVVEEDEEENHW